VGQIFFNPLKYSKPLFRPLLFGLLTVCLLYFGCLVSPSQAEDKVIRVGIYNNAPKIFMTEKGRPDGIFIDILEYIAEKEGWKLEYVFGTWAEGLDRLQMGSIDLMPDVAFTEQRNKVFSFHKIPVLSSWYQVYAPRNSDISSIFDLNGKKILVLDGSVQQESFATLCKGFGLKVDLKAVPDYDTMFKEVSSGRADAAVTNRFYGILHGKRYGLKDTAVVFEPSDLFFATAKNKNLDKLDIIDRYLAEMKGNQQSVYFTSLKKWTTEEIRLKVPFWLKAAIGFLCLVLLMVLVGNFILKRQVDARTSELRKLNQDMEQIIKERTAALVEAMEKAQAADRLKSAFLATMSHELRTPLNSIIGFTRMLLQGLAGPINREQEKQLGMVRSSARHLLELINDILDISKIEAQQLSLMSEKFNLRESIEKTVQTVLPMADKKNLRLTCRIEDDINEFLGDRRRVEQIMLNLLTNAVKFSEKGSIHLHCRKEQGHLVLSVADTGIGIPPDQIGVIFEAFRQIDTGITGTQEGTGLGLNITKKLVEMMGGSIDVQSTIGAGSTFTVKLPLKTGEAA